MFLLVGHCDVIGDENHTTRYDQPEVAGGVGGYFPSRQTVVRNRDDVIDRWRVD